MIKTKRLYKMNFSDVKEANTRLVNGESARDLAKEYNVTLHSLLKNIEDFNKTYQSKEKKLLKFEDITIDMINSVKSWKQLREIGLIVFSRYIRFKAKGRCEICNKPGLDAHHWYYTRAHGKLTDIMPSNGIFLCRNCHIKAHNEIQFVKDYISNLGKYRNKLELLKEAEKRLIDLDKAKILIKAMISEIR